MALAFTTTASGKSSDYRRYLFGAPKKVDRKGEPTRFEFALAPIDASFVKLNRGNYITFDTVTYPKWFTGYIINDPELEYLGTNSSHAPIYGYRYMAMSDDYILNLKLIGIIPPFTNATMGSIISFLANKLFPGKFNTSNVQSGLTLARFIPEPTATFGDIVNAFCEQAQYKFRANDNTLYFTPQDSTSVGITIDGNNKHFTPANLSISPSVDPIINEAVVVGDIEAQDYVNEYFYGDGLTAQFPLLLSPYGVDRSVLINEDFTGGTINGDVWTEYDTANDYLQVSAGYLNSTGGANNNTYGVYVQSKQLVPLEGNVRFTHGEFDFINAGSDAVKGIVASLWTSATPSRTSDTTFPGCVHGFRITRVSSVLKLDTIVNGTANASYTTLDTSKRYTIRTVMSALVNRSPQQYNYISSSGVVTSAVGAVKPTNFVFDTVLTEINPSTGAQTNQWTLQSTIATGLVSEQYAYYCPLISNDLKATVSGITVSVPMQAKLEIKPSGGSFATKLIGPNEMDSFDGVQPAATIIGSNNGVTTRSSLLGSPQYNPGNATLAFFKDSTKQTSTTPSKGDLIHITYRKAGAALARVRDMSAIAAEAASWLDSGIRTSVYTELSPKPRTSLDCEAAARAIVGDNSFKHYEGTYTHFSPYFSAEPLSGAVLSFSNLPSAFPTITAEEVNEVSTAMLSSKPTELFEHSLSFGRAPVIDRFLVKYRQPEGVYNPQDTAEIPKYISAASIGTTFTDDVVAPTFSSISSTQLTFAVNQSVPAYFATKYAGTVSGSGYTNPTNAQGVPNSTFATYTGTSNVDLTSSNHGFALASTATVRGIKVEIVCKESVADPFTAPTVQLQKDGVGDVGTSKSTQYTGSTTAVSRFFGGETDLWGTTWTYSEVNATGFGFRLYFDDATGTTTHSVDAMRIWVYFTDGSASVTTGGFEVRYSDEGWGCDDGKNLVSRVTSASTFTVPRNFRNTVAYVKAFDRRNLVYYSEDLTQSSAWGKDVTTTITNASEANPDGDISQISTVNFNGNYQIINPPSSGGNNMPLTQNELGEVYTISGWFKGTAGKRLRFGFGGFSGGPANYYTDITLTGEWQFASFTRALTSSDSGGLVVSIRNEFGDLTSSYPVKIARIQIEKNSVYSQYYKTLNARYGANSRYPAVLRCNFPMVPPAPTATLDYTVKTAPTIKVVLPALMQDVWGVEIRASNNSTVLYSKDLTDGAFDIVYTASGNTSRSLSYYVYTYNLLGEYSSSYNATATIPSPQMSTVTLDDATKVLKWTLTGETEDTTYEVYREFYNGSVTEYSLVRGLKAKSFTIPDYDFFLIPGSGESNSFGVRPSDSLGALSSLTTSAHNYVANSGHSFILKNGSIAPTWSSALTYSNDASSITWSWSGLTLYRIDGTTTAISNGSQAITSLSSSTTYYFYPYYNEATGAIGWVASGSGSPAYAHTAKSSTKAQEQALQSHSLFTSGAISAATTASGSGGGGSGGGDGSCLRKGMLVETPTGIKPIDKCKVGEYVKGRSGAWTKIVMHRIIPQDVFVRVTLSNGGVVEVTPTHPFTLIDESTKRAHELGMCDVLWTDTGIDTIQSIEAVKRPKGLLGWLLRLFSNRWYKVSVTCEPEHEFYAGESKPTVLTHNLLEMT